MKIMSSKPFRLILQASICTSAAKLSKRQGLKGFQKDAPLKWFEVPGKKTVQDTPRAARNALRMEGEQALQMYERLRRHGVRPHIPLVLAAIKACVFRKELVKIHGDVVKSKDDQDTSVSNALIEMFAKAGGLKDSREIFDRATKRDIASWNTMMSCYIQNREPEKALELFSKITDDSLLPDARTYLFALNACSLQAMKEEVQEIQGKLLKPVSLSIGSRIHSQLVQSQHDLDTFVESALVDMYARCGSVEQAQKIFDQMERHDSVCWTALIFGYSSSRGDWALELFIRMKEEGFVPDSRTFAAALNACSSLSVKESWKRVNGRLLKPASLDKGRALHIELDKVGIQLDNALETALVDMYSKCGSLVEAGRVFDKMFRHDSLVWTSLILGYADYGDGDQALQLFARMQDLGVRPDSKAYIAALAACGSLANKEGRNIEQRFMKKLAIEKGTAIHSQISRAGLEANVFVANALLEMYFRCGSIENAEQVFGRMVNPNAGSWNSMILGYALNKQAGEALKLFSAMQHLGLKPTSLTFVAALKACTIAAAFETGKRLHLEIPSAGVGMNSRLAASLVEFYGKCCCMEEAQRVFDEAGSNDLSTWTALLSGYSDSGNFVRVFELFKRMEELEFEMDGVALLGVLRACECAGLAEEGKKLFGEMSWKYNVSPGIDHCGSLVNLLGRANQLGEAVRLLREARVDRSPSVWIKVLEACYRWNNVEVGKLAFQSALEPVPDANAGAAHVLMAKIYENAGLLEDCQRIESMASKISAESRWVDEKTGAVLSLPRYSGDQLRAGA